jgi:hypothetical protein
MFEHLKQHDQIVIVGPQRAGTTIATKMIANDLGYETFLEEQILYDYNYLQGLIIGNRRKNVKGVYQAPNFTAYSHLLAGEPAIIIMVRKTEDIIASQMRINWGGPGGTNEKNELARYFRDSGIASKVKYEVWKKFQKAQIKYPYELEYESLKTHPMWVDKKDRTNFGPRQTEIQ